MSQELLKQLYTTILELNYNTSQIQQMCAQLLQQEGVSSIDTSVIEESVQGSSAEIVDSYNLDDNK